MADDNQTDLENAEAEARLKSVSAGGESVSYDTNAAKANARAMRNSDITSQAAGKTRPTFGKIKFRGIY